MNADEILRIPVDRPEMIFSKDNFEKDFKKLIKEWHPDLNKDPKATIVSSHLSILRRAALQKHQAGEWLNINPSDPKIVDPGFRFYTTGTSTVRVKMKRMWDFELGKAGYSAHHALWEVGNQWKSMFDNGIATIGTFPYASPNMKVEFERYFPKITKIAKTSDSGMVLISEKTEGSYSLRDVVDSQNGLPAEHVAWIMSGLLNICCYLQWAKLSHGDISLDTVFIEPETHTTMLLGGWWYTTDFGSGHEFLPQRSIRFAPRDLLTYKIADGRLDLILSKKVAAEALKNRPVPEPMRQFLREAPSGSATEEYKHWQNNVLERSFGPRKFVELKVDETEIFKERT